MIRKSDKMTKKSTALIQGSAYCVVIVPVLEVYIETCSEDAVATGELVVGTCCIAIVGCLVVVAVVGLEVTHVDRELVIDFVLDTVTKKNSYFCKVTSYETLYELRKRNVTL